MPLGPARLRLVGDIDRASSKMLSETAYWLTALAPASVVIDLAAVTFAGSALLNFLSRLSGALPTDTDLILWRPQPGIEMILRVPGLTPKSILYQGPLEPWAMGS
ncbi:STAS domain-containing protein [Cryptosporangium sp. NPDC048952]|uniref:STAS domain-containing protein n=1 Tax=Cryptosporangium sp. NPDC048952 TaxID=3363961 RepID=UPI00371735E2